MVSTIKALTMRKEALADAIHANAIVLNKL